MYILPDPGRRVQIRMEWGRSETEREREGGRERDESNRDPARMAKS